MSELTGMPAIPSGSGTVPAKVTTSRSTVGIGGGFTNRRALTAPSRGQAAPSAFFRIERSMERRISPLPGRINAQYRPKYRRLFASAHFTRVSVASSHMPSFRSTTLKFHATRAVPGIREPLNVATSMGRRPPFHFQNEPISPIRSSCGGFSANTRNP